jgi:hypothetical protein
MKRSRGWTQPARMIGIPSLPSLPEARIPLRNRCLRAFIEVGFIVVLFYSNLLMGEFERSGMARTRGLVWALRDVFTSSNFVIAIIAALIGYVLFEFLRNRL